MSLVPLYSLTDSIKEGALIAGLHVGSTEGDISHALRRFRLFATFKAQKSAQEAILLKRSFVAINGKNVAIQKIKK